MEHGEWVCPLVKHEKILVAVDGSKYSEMAFTQAINIAKACRSSLFVISVIPLYPGSLALGAPTVVEKMEKETREILERAKDQATKENVPCETIVHEGGQPHEFIVEEAKKKKIDVIVMGTHGRTGLKKLLMGSVTERVIGYAPCTVLVVPG